MENQIVLEFKNIIQELTDKNIRLCFMKSRGIFLIDNKGNLYMMENYWYGSYLDRLIKDGVIVKFDLVNAPNIDDWGKEIWGVSEVRAFIERHQIK